MHFKMLYLVVHHKSDTHQPYRNSWLDDCRLDAILTPAEVAELCEEAMRKNTQIGVHRCGWSAIPPTVCCMATVVSVDAVGQGMALVKFGKQESLNLSPQVQPSLGRNYYIV